MLAQIKKLGFLFPALFLFALPAHAQLGTIQGFCDNGGNHSLTSGQPSSNYLQGNIPLCTVSVFYHDTTTLAPIFMGESSTGTLKDVQVTAGGSYSVCPTGVTFTGGGGSGATATVSCTSGAVVSVAVTSPGSGYTTAPTVGFTGGTGSGATAVATIVGDLTNPFTANTDGSWRVWAAIATGYDVTMSGGIPPNSYAQPRTIANIFPNAFGGTSYTIIQANGSASAPTSPVNFINSTTVSFSITGNQISAAVNAGKVLALQHNSSATNIDQSLLNIWDSPSSLSGGSLDTGYQPVVGKTDAVGGWGFETLAASSNFSQGIATPPTTGQTYTIYPTSFTTLNCGFNTDCGTSNPPGAYMEIARFGPDNGGLRPQITSSGYALPSSIPAANVTNVYGCVQGSASVQSGVVFIGGTAGPTGVSGPPSQLKTTCTLLASGSGAATYNFAAATIILQTQCTIGCSPPGSASYQPFLYITYTGTPAPQNNWFFQYPLNMQGNSVGLLPGFISEPVWDTGTANAYVGVTASVTNLIPGQIVPLIPANANTGASTFTFNTATAVALTKCGGTALASGDMTATAPADVQYQTNGTWLLLNPLTGCGAGSAITALTGDVTATGPGSATATLANTAVVPGSYTNTNLTVDSKGRITAASNGSAGGSGLSGMTPGQVPIAATATTVTSSKALAGAGTGIATGPTTTTLNDCVKFGDTAGTLVDAGAACGTAGGSVSVNGSTVSSPNFNGTTPAAPSGNTNGTFQVSGSNVSVYFPNVVSSYPAINVQNAPYNAKGDGVIAWDGSMAAQPTPQSATTGTTATAPAVTTNFANEVVVSAFMVYNATASAPSAGTSRLNTTPGTTVSRQLVSDQTVAVAGAVPAVTSTLSVSTQWSGHTLALVPTSGNTISFIAVSHADDDTASTTLTVTKPTGTATGDVEVAFGELYNNNGTVTITAPAQFPNVGFSAQPISNWGGTSGNQVLMWTHVVTANEPASYTWTFSANTAAHIAILTYRNVGAIDNPITQTLWAATTAFTTGQQIRDSNGCLEQAQANGTTAGTVPTWPACTAGNSGVTTTDGTVTWILRKAAPNWAAGDAGKLLCMNQGCGTVGQYVSSTEILPIGFANQSSTAVSGTEYRYASDDTAALQSAINAAPATIVIPQANYGLSGSLNFTPGVPMVLTGVSSGLPSDPDALAHHYLEGIDNTNLGSSLWELTNSLKSGGLNLNGNGSQNNSSTPQVIQNLGLFAGTGTTGNQGGENGIDIVDWDSAYFSNVVVGNFIGNGVYIDATTAGNTYSELDFFEKGASVFNGANGVLIGSGATTKYLDSIGIMQNELSYNKLAGLATAGFVNLLTVDQNKINANQQGNTGTEASFGSGGPNALHMTGNYFETGCDGDTATGYFNITQRMAGSATIYPNYFSTICATVAVPVPVFSVAGVPLNPAGNQNAHGYACVSDASVACTAGSTYAGSGTNKCQVQSNGTNWLYTGAQCF